jgi:hypothetical protein
MPFDGFGRSAMPYLFHDGPVFFKDPEKLRFILLKLSRLDVDF